RTVLILPPLEAGMTRVRSMTRRISVMPHSRSKIRIVIHHQISPKSDIVIHAAPVRNLSAMGSAILPKFVTRPLARAISPSSLSVYMAAAKMATASQRAIIESWPNVPEAHSAQIKNGTSAMRMLVSTLGRFSELTCPLAAMHPRIHCHLFGHNSILCQIQWDFRRPGLILIQSVVV